MSQNAIALMRCAQFPASLISHAPACAVGVLMPLGMMPVRFQTQLHKQLWGEVAGR